MPAGEQAVSACALHSSRRVASRERGRSKRECNRVESSAIDETSSDDAVESDCETVTPPTVKTCAIVASTHDNADADAASVHSPLSSLPLPLAHTDDAAVPAAVVVVVVVVVIVVDAASDASSRLNLSISETPANAVS